MSVPQALEDYARLSPDLVLAAVESTGRLSDLRVLALNSYENRVYQVGIEDDSPVIAKFYRPGRWSDAALCEEHAFTRELAAAELPVVAPLGRCRPATPCSAMRTTALITDSHREAETAKAHRG